MIVNKTAEIAKTVPQSLWHPVLSSAKVGTFNRGLGIFFRLLTIPLVINHLGMERYGIWMTIASFSAYVMMLDLGISAALVNRLTCLYTASEREKAEEYVASAMLTLSGLAACCIAASLIAIPNFDWGILFKLTTPEIGRETLTAVLIVLTLFFLQLPFSVILKVPYAMQTGWLSEAYQLAGTIVSLVGTVTGVFMGAGLPVLVFFLAGGPLFAGAALFVHFLVTKKLRPVLPPLQTIRRRVREIHGTGLDFMLMQSAGMLMNSLQFTMLAIYHGAEAVAPYGLITQVLIALQVPFTVLQQPMWSRMAQFGYLSDSDSIRGMLAKYVKYACIYSVPTSIFIIFLVNPLFSFILHKPVLIPLDLRIGFAVACTLGLVAGGGIGTVLLALNLSRPMALIALLQLVLFLVCVFVFVPGYGMVAMVWSVSVTYILGIPPSLWILLKKLRSFRGGVSA